MRDNRIQDFRTLCTKLLDNQNQYNLDLLTSRFNNYKNDNTIKEHIILLYSSLVARGVIKL
jgi:hypothetical protein